MARQLVVDGFVGTAAELSWRARVKQDELRTGRERYLDYPEVWQVWEKSRSRRWEELTGAAYVCDEPAFSGGCGR